MKTIKFAMVQMDIIHGDIDANENHVTTLLDDVEKHGADLVVFPELWNTGYDLERLDFLRCRSEQSMKFLRQQAKDRHIMIVGGSIPEKKDGVFYNMCPVITELGTVAGKYRKAHLFPLALHEHRYFSPGSEWGIVETEKFTLGTMLCYDLRFPELCRNLALRGANLIVVPAQWPAARENHWRVLLQARAIENQAFLLGVNRIGRDDNGLIYHGHSMAVAPDGTILAEGQDREEILYGEIDFSKVTEISHKIPVFADRKNILDEIDNSYL